MDGQLLDQENRAFGEPGSVLAPPVTPFIVFSSTNGVDGKAGLAEGCKDKRKYMEMGVARDLEARPPLVLWLCAKWERELH